MAIASSLVVAGAAHVALPTAAIAQDDDPLADIESVDGGSEGEGEEAGEDLVVEVDAQTYADKIRGLFVPGESGVLAERQVQPESRRLLRLGKVDLLPKWDQAVVFDDNVFLTRRGREDDVIIRTTLGLVAETIFGGGDHRFVVGYDHERNYFTGGEAQNYVEHFASALLQMSFNRFEFDIGNRYENRTDPVIAAFTGLIDRQLNTTFGRARWSDEEWYLELRGANTTLEFNNSGFRSLDRDERQGIVEYGGPMNETAESFFQVGVAARKFEHNGLNDMNGVVLTAGVRADVNENLNVMARLGVRSESYDDTFATDGGDDDETAPEAELQVHWLAHQDGILDFSYVHTLEFSPISNFQEVDRGQLQYSTGLASNLRLQVAAAAELVQPSNATRFERYTGRAGLRFALMQNAHLTLEYQRVIRTAANDPLRYLSNVAALAAEIRF